MPVNSCGRGCCGSTFQQSALEATLCVWRGSGSYSSFGEFDSSGKAALVATEAIVILSVGSLCRSQSALRTEHSGLARCGLWRITRCVHLCPKPDIPHGLAAGGLRAPPANLSLWVPSHTVVWLWGLGKPIICPESAGQFQGCTWCLSL